MINLRLAYSIIFSILFIHAVGQDTTFIDEPSNYYSGTEDSLRFKFRKGPRVDYSRELIKFTDNHYKIENCYYYDGKRFTSYFSISYTLINDSLIKINDEIWHFLKIQDSLYSVTRSYYCCIEKGTVSSLIPFVKNGDFTTYNLNGKAVFIDKLEIGSNKAETIKYDIQDSVYIKVDKVAQFPEKYGDLKRYINDRLKMPNIARESAIQGTVFIRCVISSKGEVLNAEIVKGVDPVYDKEALRLVSCLPNFEPGQVNGKSVNMYYHIPVSFILK